MSQTPAALARRARYEAAANDPYHRILKEANEDAERAYSTGCLCDSEGVTLEIEVELYKMRAWALGLYERCQYLDWQIQRLEARTNFDAARGE